MVKNLEEERKRARTRNKEHTFYRTALNCYSMMRSTPDYQISAAAGSKKYPKNDIALLTNQVNSGESSRNKSNSISLSRRSRHQSQSQPISRPLSGNPIKNTGGMTAENGDKNVNLRYSLKQYKDLINHIWHQQLDLDNKQEIPEGKFFKFLRDQKIITEKKQLDEMYKQCLFAKHREEVSVGATVPFALYQRLFEKPLMLIGMENSLSLIECTTAVDTYRNQNRDQLFVSGERHHSASPTGKVAKQGKNEM